MKIDAKEFLKQIRESDDFHVEGAKIDFSLELKRAMDRMSLNQSQLADLLDVSRPMVSKLLGGNANVTIETMVKASRRLGCNLLIKLVAQDRSARFFEVVRHMTPQRELVDRLPLQSGSWSFAANDQDREGTNEAQSIAA